MDAAPVRTPARRGRSPSIRSGSISGAASSERFLATKAPHLARRLRSFGRPVAIWRAGATGKRVARALEPHGVRAGRFVDIDPGKIGGRARGAPVVAPAALGRGEEVVVVAVGVAGARADVQAYLEAAGFQPGSDYLCAA